MIRRLILISLALFAFTLALADRQTQVVDFNSRVAGDELIWKSTHGLQNIDFDGQARYDISYPQDGSHSPFKITHIHMEVKENSGFVSVAIEGGCGTDFANISLITNGVRDGDFTIYIYGLNT